MRTILRAALVAALVPAAAPAQAPTGTLVVSLTGQASETGARVRVMVTTADAESRLVRADSGTKEVSIGSLAAGRYRVETRAIGYTPDTAFVDVRNGRDAVLTVHLERVTELDPVTVAGTSKGHLAPFARRRAAGKGTFLTREDIDKTRRTQIGDVLRSVRGLRVNCAGGNCRVVMARATGCEPRYFINGFPTDAAILQTPVLDVAGIEVYRGPSETPPEYQGSKSMCGAIGIWTK